MVAARLGLALLALLGLPGAARAQLPGSDDFAVSIGLDRTRVVSHQQVVLVVEVEHPDQARATWEPPAFEGFWMERLATRTDRASVSGRRATRFRRALFPAYPGTLAIPESVLRIHRTGQPDRQVGVPGAQVVVDPLPEPSGAGAGATVVGEIQIRASTSRQRVRMGDAVEVTLELWGEGNVWDAAVPDLESLLADSVEVFPERRRLFVGESAGRATTRWTLRYSLVPEQTGVQRIPSLEVPWFDPEARAYRMARSEPVAFRVVDASAVRENEAPWEDEPPIPAPAPLAWRWIVGIPMAGLAFSILFLRRWSRATRARFAGPAAPSPRAAYEEAVAALGSQRFPALLGHALKAGIHARHHLDVMPLTTDEIARRVDDSEAVRLLRELDALRFTGRGQNPEALLGEVRSYLRL